MNMKKLLLLAILFGLVGCTHEETSSAVSVGVVYPSETTPVPVSTKEPVPEATPDASPSPEPQETVEPMESVEEVKRVGAVSIAIVGGEDGNDNVTETAACSLMSDMSTILCNGEATGEGLGGFFARDNGEVTMVYRMAMSYLEDEILNSNGVILRFFDVYGSAIPSFDAYQMLSDVEYYAHEAGEEDTLLKVLETYPFVFAAGDFVDGVCDIKPIEVPEVFVSDAYVDEEAKDRVRRQLVDFGTNWNIKATVNEGQRMRVDAPEGYVPVLYFLPRMIEAQVELVDGEERRQVTSYMCEIDDAMQAIGFYIIALEPLAE